MQGFLPTVEIVVLVQGGGDGRGDAGLIDLRQKTGLQGELV